MFKASRYISQLDVKTVAIRGNRYDPESQVVNKGDRPEAIRDVNIDHGYLQVDRIVDCIFTHPSRREGGGMDLLVISPFLSICINVQDGLIEDRASILGFTLTIYGYSYFDVKK